MGEQPSRLFVRVAVPPFDFVRSCHLKTRSKALSRWNAVAFKFGAAKAHEPVQLGRGPDGTSCTGADILENKTQAIMSDNELRPVYLWPGKLQIGDVILLNGAEKLSRWIAFFDGGPYSHAQLVVEEGRILEADDPGVDFEFLPKVYARGKDVDSSLFKVVSYQGKLRVLRHPLLKQLSQAKVQAAISRTCDKYLHDPYAYKWRLLGPMRFIWPVRFVLTLFARLFDSREMRERQLEGRFCSELIGLFFKELDLSLFKNEWAPHQIGPNDLCSRYCNLEVVDGVEADSSRFTNVLDLSHPAEENDIFEESKRIATTMKIAAARSEKELEKVRAMARQYRSERKIQFDGHFSDLTRAITFGLEIAQFAGEDDERRLFVSFRQRFDAIFPLAQRAYATDKDRTPDEAHTALFDLLTLQFEVNRHLLLRRLKRNRPGKNASCLEVWRFNRDRKDRLARMRDLGAVVASRRSSRKGPDESQDSLSRDGI